MSRRPTTANPTTESRSLMHCPSLPGFTFMDARNSSTPWRVYNYQYAVGIPSTWVASVMIDRQQSDFGPGDGLFVVPGELHWTPKIKRPGDLRALVIDDDAFHQLAEEAEFRRRPAGWKQGFARPSRALVAGFNQLAHLFSQAPEPLRIQTQLVEFFAVLAREQLVGSRSEAKLGPRGAATRMRELIHHSPTGLTLDLSELAAAVGLTRFQALRVFKRRYGLPPHSYQLTVRISVARRLLEQGENPTHVAHAAGFVDQSHMTHYFKRMYGITPGSYARSAAQALFPGSGNPSERTDGVLWSV